MCEKEKCMGHSKRRQSLQIEKWELVGRATFPAMLVVGQEQMHCRGSPSWTRDRLVTVTEIRSVTDRKS